jgi:hypothetical protein
MHEWVLKLHVLQEKDLRIAKIEEQVEGAPAERAKVQQLLDDAKAVTAAAKNQVIEEEKGLKDLDLQAETIRARMRDFQTKSAMIKSNDEYRAALQQIESCARQVNELEDRQLAIMDRIETHRVSLQKAQKDQEAVESRVREMLTDLETRETNCKSQMDILMAERAAALVGIYPELVSRYERLRVKKRHAVGDRRVLVPIRNNACDRCHMNAIAQVRMNARKGMPVSCENCGALLYWED